MTHHDHDEELSDRVIERGDEPRSVPEDLKPEVSHHTCENKTPAYQGDDPEGCSLSDCQQEHTIHHRPVRRLQRLLQALAVKASTVVLTNKRRDGPNRGSSLAGNL